MISIFNIFEQATSSDERTNKKLRHIANSALIGGLIGAGIPYLYGKSLDPFSSAIYPYKDQMIKGGLLGSSLNALISAYEASSKRNPFDNEYSKEFVKNKEEEKNIKKRE